MYDHRFYVNAYWMLCDYFRPPQSMPLIEQSYRLYWLVTAQYNRQRELGSNITGQR